MYQIKKDTLTSVFFTYGKVFYILLKISMSNADEIKIIVSAVDKFSPELKYIEKKAYDTKKKLDETTVVNLKANVLGFQMALNDAKEQLKKVSSMEDKIKLELDIIYLKKQLSEAKRAMNNYLNTWSEWLSRLQAKFNQIGDSMLNWVKWGLIGAAFWMMNVVKWLISWAKEIAINFESAFAGVKKTIEATAWGFQGLKKELKDMATEIPVGFEELSKIAELWWQLWIAKKDLKDFTKVIANLWVSTNLSTEQAAAALARIANVFQLSSKDYERLWNTIVQLGNNFATTESEIVDFSGYLMASAKTAGFTADEVFAIGTTLSSVWIKAEAGGSAFSKAISTINTAVATWDKTVKDFAKVAGLSAEEFATQWKSKPAEAFTKFVEWLGDEGSLAIPIIQDLLGNNIRLQNGMLATANAGSILRDALAMASEEYANGSALQSEAEKRYETARSKLAMLDNELDNMSETLGKKAIPAMVRRKEVLVDVHAWINNLFGATDVFSEYLWELTDMITENEESVKSLTEQYRNGEITKDEYMSQLKELHHQQIQLKNSYDEEVDALKKEDGIMEELEKKLKKSWEYRKIYMDQLEETKQKLEEERQQYWKNEEGLFSLSWQYQQQEEILAKQIEYEKKLTDEIVAQKVKQEERLQSLKNIDKINEKVTSSQKKYNTQLENFNWIKIDDSWTRSEFEASKKSALAAAKAFETALNAKIAYLTGGKGMTVSLIKSANTANSWPRVPISMDNQFKEAIALQKQKMEITKQISDIEAKEFNWTGNWYKATGSSGSKKDPIAQKKKELEQQKLLEIEAVKSSALSEEDKLKKLLEIKQKYDRLKTELEWKTDEELLKEAENYMKKLQKKREDDYKDHQDKSNKAIKDVKKYTESLDKIKKKFEEIKEKAKDTLRDIKHNMGELDKNYVKDLGSRYYEVKKQIRDNRRNNTGLERLESYNKESLEKWRDMGQKEINNIDLDTVIEQINLKEELLYLEKNLTKEQQEQAKVEAEKSESVKITEKYEKERKAMQEKESIAEAFSSAEGVTKKMLEVTEDSVRYWDESKGRFVEITDYKNQEYARDLYNQQIKLETEYKTEQKHLEDSKKLVETHAKEVIKIRQDLTSAQKQELNQREADIRTYVDNVKRMMSEIGGIAGVASAGSVVNNNNQQTNSNNTTTNNTTYVTVKSAPPINFNQI